MSTETQKVEAYAWSGGKCRVPMWSGYGSPAGLCGDDAFGPQLPVEILQQVHGPHYHPPYCFGPCCPMHGGPREGEPILFQDGTDSRGRRMWCAVMPDFENLQESPAGFSIDPIHAIQKLRDEVTRVGGAA